MPATLAHAIGHAQARLTETLKLDEAEARLEAQVLLAQALQKPRSYIIAHESDCLQSKSGEAFQALLGRRLTGEPVAYILGQREFFSLDFKVTAEVLIPRPETELLVELALARLPPDQPCNVLDLGAGSGAVAIAIARHRPLAQVTAVDQSKAALAVAQENAQRLQAPNVQLRHSDWYGALHQEPFDLIVSNPPYIAGSDTHLSQGDLRFEPRSALVGGGDGLDCIRAIISGAGAHLKPGGWLLFEHGYDQASACRELLEQAGFAKIASYPDLAGILRVSGGSAMR